MKIYTWTDRRVPNPPRATLQQGRCESGHCRQFAFSVSNGTLGMTVRFESEAEFREFLERGESLSGSTQTDAAHHLEPRED